MDHFLTTNKHFTVAKPKKYNAEFNSIFVFYQCIAINLVFNK